VQQTTLGESRVHTYNRLVAAAAINAHADDDDNAPDQTQTDRPTAADILITL